MNATTAQISSSLWAAPYDAMPVILMPFLMIQSNSALRQRFTASGRYTASGLRPLPMLPGSLPGAP